MQFIRRPLQLASSLRPSLQQMITETPGKYVAERNFSMLRSFPLVTHVFAPVDNLLSVAPVQLQPSAGFKAKVNLRRRCKDCYFVRRQDRLFVICPTHRRHKQMQIVKDEKNTWILSHATQGKVRPW